jgi:hypothetical protein
MAKQKQGYDPQWAKAKTVCRLNMEDIRMAKALGMSPKSLLKNNPSPTQRWKAPVKFWIRELYEKRFGNERRSPLASSSTKSNIPSPETRTESGNIDDDIPF